VDALPPKRPFKKGEKSDRYKEDPQKEKIKHNIENKLTSE
jgi:hypothetical protein